MKLYLPKASEQKIGGGFTFYNNFKKGSNNEFVTHWEDADLILITGATMTDRTEMQLAKHAGKPIVFRVDNIPKDSRNRGTAFSRMLDFARMADWIVFQSQWAQDYAGWWFGENGVDITNKSCIIYNGVDMDIFYLPVPATRNNRYLFVQYNRDENKRYPEAFYDFHMAYRQNKNAELWLVGRFSPELIENNFDFFAGEQVSYLGVIEDRKQLADIYRDCQYLLFPAFADASPNTVMEAQACGCTVVGVNPVGGTQELLELDAPRSIQDMAKDYQELFEKICQRN